MMKTQGRGAFSLVELSIVLVILGLLVGGILSGQSLIRAAELRTVYTQYSTIYTGLQSFRDKYFQLPGDMNNATSFWGALSTTNDTTCQAIPANGTTATCNGNGNGQIGPTYVVAGDEQFRVWQHLANAGLITGSYTGVTSSQPNTPTVKLNGTGFWRLLYANVDPGSTSSFSFGSGNLLRWPVLR